MAKTITADLYRQQGLKNVDLEPNERVWYVYHDGTRSLITGCQRELFDGQVLLLAERNRQVLLSPQTLLLID